MNQCTNCPSLTCIGCPHYLIVRGMQDGHMQASDVLPDEQPSDEDGERWDTANEL